MGIDRRIIITASSEEFHKMTEPEFWQWYGDYAAAFPGVDAKLGAIKDADNLKGESTLKHWLKAFADVELSDAIEVTSLMVMGDIVAIRDFEIGTTAAVVRKHAKDLAYKRNKPAEVPDWKRVDTRTERVAKTSSGSCFTRSMKADMQEVLRMKAAGASPLEIKAFLKQQYPEDHNDRRERYACLRCRSTGFVRVWSERSMRACLDGKIDVRENRTTATIPCDCTLGAKKVSNDPKHEAAFKRCFNVSLDCPCIDPDDMDAINDLETWCDEKRNEKPANYETRFDDYNNRQHEEPF